MTVLEQMGAKAQQASRFLALASAEEKNRALTAMAQALIDHQNDILQANQMDLEKGKEAGLTTALLDRLMLNEQRISDMAKGMRDICQLHDPIGKIDADFTLENGLHIQKVRVPMGVIGIIYEARPNVTADAAALCIKAGNAVILRGGKEAFRSNCAIMNIMRNALEQEGFPADCAALVQDTTRESSTELMRLKQYLDLLIPRGGAGLIRAVVENSTVPVIETGVGNCHIYVDESADLDMAAQIIYNAKTSRPSVCNACETVLVHQAVAKDALPKMKQLLDQKNVQLRGCERTRAILGDCVQPATEEDYQVEFLDYILAVKVVDSLEQAIDHITKYSSHHSDCIVTQNEKNAVMFTRAVDSAAVYVNASTRFTDGGQFGLGAEIGISTQKLHARGPMGLEELTSYKYVILGNGQVRE